MVVNATKISQEMKKNKLVEYRRKYYKMRKKHYIIIIIILVYKILFL